MTAINNYENGCIYKISVGDEFYIGSTIDFIDRKCRHERDMKTLNYKLYKAIRNNNNNFLMEKLYNYPCKNKTELRIEEQKCYDELKPILNTHRPYNSKDDKKQYRKNYYQDNKDILNEKQKQYQLEHKEKYADYNKQYRIDNKDTLKIQRKTWEQNNSEKLKQNRKVYYEDNKDIICKNQKQYRIDNNDKLKQYHKQYNDTHKTEKQEYDKQYRIDNNDKIQNIITCECGGTYQNKNKHRHFKTKKHIKFLNNSV